MIQACTKKEILLFAVQLIVAVLPSVLIYLQKLFFTTAEQFIFEPSKHLRNSLLLVLSAWGTVMLIQWVINWIKDLSQRVIQAKVSNYLMNSLLAKISRIRFEYMDTPEVYNKLEFVSNQLLDRIYSVIYSTMSLMSNIIVLISMGGLIFLEDWRAGLIVLVGSIPACYFMYLQNTESYHRNQWEAPELRQQWYVYRLFTRRDSIREMRIGQYSQHLVKKWEDLSLKLRNHRYKYIRKFYFFSLLSNIVGYVSIGLALWLISIRVLQRDSAIGIGSFVLVYNVAGSLQSVTKNIFFNLVSVATTGKYLKDYQDLSGYPEEVLIGESDPIPEAVDITFENVSFSYPNTERLVLKDVNVTIKQGEKVAIVGENGSGKTTFILLLSGLYRPQKGKTTFVGKDLMDNLGLMRRATSFVFQDFGRYQITVADNIRIGNLYRDLSDQEIKLAAKRSGADEFIEKLDQKYNTFLGTLEEGHTDLSGGQWQKLAFARAITRQEARVMILDEQTAALDPISEAKFYHDFKDLTGDRTAIMISHRLGATKLVDRILVFDEGKIVEEGTHDELIHNKGIYYEMYEAQAQWYSA